MRSLVLTLALLGSCHLPAQTRATIPTPPPCMKHPLIPSHGSNLLGVFYVAAGIGPHPTAVLFHGLPGYEQNLDLAQALRREGWNVLAMHYRGSWGVSGQFSFLHAAEDADAQVNFLLDLKNVEQYHIDPSRIVLIGHSMGGLMAASATAHNPKVKAVVMLSAWNIGASGDSNADEENQAKAFASNDNLAPIAGTTATNLAHEAHTHHAELDMLNFVSAIAPRPVMIITASDGSDQFSAPFVAALREAGDVEVKQLNFATDHPYSGKRLELASAVLNFLKTE